MKYTVLDFLEETAAIYADKIAFSDTNESVTWAQFVANAKRLSFFIAKNFPARAAVPVMMEKSVKCLEYFFAAIYAGCFYSYFDSTFPESRLQSMAKTLKAKKIVCEKKFEKKIAALDAAPLFAEEIFDSDFEGENQNSRTKNLIDTDPVYANFTSGTTGEPKAVLVSHKNIADFISCFAEIFDITAQENLANQAPFDFDVSAKDIFCAVWTGAAVHLVPKSYFSFPAKLLDFLDERKITTLIWAVSALCIISSLNGFSYKVPSGIKKILFSGEVMPLKHLLIWKRYLPNAEYANLYGPTKITCNCAYFKLPREIPLDYAIPMGSPFPNERIFLLDENDKEISAFETEGEVCVSGSCVALGYYDNPKTEEVFVQNPQNKNFFERIYRTGDLAKIGRDGLFYYCGRKDFQIKHMGHRIELLEIEGAAEKVDGISRACCVFSENKIFLFYAGTQIEKKEIVAAVKKILPPYMIPFDFIFVKEMPLTKNGKIDRRLLEAKLAKSETEN